MYKLIRWFSGKTGTFGGLVKNGKPFCLTLEPEVPIIPNGIYKCKRYLSPKRGYVVYKLENVPGHEAVQIHIGNTIADTEGCILIGQSLSEYEGIAYSRIAFDKFMHSNKGDITLEVV